MKYSIFRGSDRKKMAFISAGVIAVILILGVVGVIVLKPKAELLFEEIAAHISFDDLWYIRQVLRMAGKIVFFAAAVILIRKLKKKHGK